MSENPLSQKELKKVVFFRILMIIPVFIILFFLPAGTLYYWEAWVYLAILMIPMVFVMRYFLRTNPQFLERRMRMREKESAQKKIIKFSTAFLLLAFILPGFDKRWDWSYVPFSVVIIADFLVLISYLFIVRVFKENSYASRIIEVEKEQKVISSGLYSIVRHPMYLGVAVMYSASPLALGSWYALIPAVMVIPVLVARILNEEKVLSRDLTGYSEYIQKVKYRLIPGIW
jgi:protein-S-isoprenylcysteine O-methyltransferase Ste14